MPVFDSSKLATVTPAVFMVTVPVPEFEVKWTLVVVPGRAVTVGEPLSVRDQWPAASDQLYVPPAPSTQ